MDGHEGLSSNPSTHIKKKVKHAQMHLIRDRRMVGVFWILTSIWIQ